MFWFVSLKHFPQKADTHFGDKLLVDQQLKKLIPDATKTQIYDADQPLESGLITSWSVWSPCPHRGDHPGGNAGASSGPESQQAAYVSQHHASKTGFRLVP